MFLKIYIIWKQSKHQRTGKFSGSDKSAYETQWTVQQALHLSSPCLNDTNIPEGQHMNKISHYIDVRGEKFNQLQGAQPSLNNQIFLKYSESTHFRKIVSKELKSSAK